MIYFVEIADRVDACDIDRTLYMELLQAYAVSVRRKRHTDNVPEPGRRIRLEYM
jgi:hypothetical protein